MTASRGEFSVTALLEGQPTLLEVPLWGLSYTGEVVLADAWRPTLAAEHSPLAAFRIVLLREPPPQFQPAEIADPAAAVCLPRRTSTVRDRPATYAPAREQGHRTLPSLEEFAQGVILRSRGPRIDGRQHFSAGSWHEALISLATVLLREGYPAPAVDLTHFPGPLMPQHIEPLWNALFRKEPPLDISATVRTLAPALGISTPEHPTTFSFTLSTVKDSLRGATQGKQPRVTDLARVLLQEHGLPPYLGLLYILAYVCEQGAALEVTWQPDTPLPWLIGPALSGQTLTPHLLSGLPWTADLLHGLDSVRPRQEATWSLVRPYLDLLFPSDAIPQKDPTPLLARRHHETSETRESLTTLAETLGRSQQTGVFALLDRSLEINASRSPGEFRAAIERHYPSVLALQEDAHLYPGVQALAAGAEQVLSYHVFLQQARLGPGQEELEMERLAILQQLSINDLARTPALLRSLEDQFTQFRTRYAAVYRERHAAHRVQMHNLHGTLERVSPQTQALRRLNGIPELGLALGGRELQAYPRLLADTEPCPITETHQLPLETLPYCPQCGYRLTDSSPEPQVRTLQRDLTRALEGQYRRLSSHAIKQVLTRSNEDRILRFLQVIGASDVSSLTDFLDDDLASFIHEFLQTEIVQGASFSIFQALAARFPTLGEEDIDVAAAEFASLAREALTQARQQRPHQPVRITLT